MRTLGERGTPAPWTPEVLRPAGLPSSTLSSRPLPFVSLLIFPWCAQKRQPQLSPNSGMTGLSQFECSQCPGQWLVWPDPCGGALASEVGGMAAGVSGCSAPGKNPPSLKRNTQEGLCLFFHWHPLCQRCDAQNLGIRCVAVKGRPTACQWRSLGKKTLGPSLFWGHCINLPWNCLIPYLLCVM